METEMRRRKEFASPMAGKTQRILSEYIKLLFKDRERCMLLRNMKLHGEMGK